MYYISKKKSGLTLDMLKAKSSQKSLIEHCYETATMAEELMVNGTFNVSVNALSKKLNVPFQNIKNAICFFAFIHDVGKAHPAFQYKLIPDLLNDLGYTEMPQYEGFRHEEYSLEIIRDNILDDDFVTESLSMAVALHHQGKKNSKTLRLPAGKESVWQDMQKEIIDTGKNLYPFDVSMAKECDFNGLCEFFLGIINTADWAASTQEVFDNAMVSDYNNVLDYLSHIKKQADYFIEKNLLDNKTLNQRFHNPSNYYDILLGSFSPRPLQQEIANISKQIISDGAPASCTIIEADCGEGKTEAALYEALQTYGDRTGLEILLPTAATSESMRERINSLCKYISNDFQVPVYNSTVWLKDGNLSLDSDLWESDSKLQLLYPISVATIDQALKSVSNIKHGDIPLIALSNKVVIIDEAHAYDTYMTSEIKRLLNYLGFMQVPVIILSATLTKQDKKDFIESYCHRKVKIDSSQYPLITSAYNSTVIEKTFHSTKGKSVDIKLLPLEDMNYSILQQAINDKMINGGNAVVVFNTVKSAQQFADFISSDILLHSRLTIVDRNSLEKKILKQYGKKDKEHNRPKESIVVSTQIIEQSLDVDFDFMFTEICPIDLLIQRIGRDRRHDNTWTIRESFPSKDEIVVFYDNNEFGKSKRIYGLPILQSTFEWLQSHPTLVMPNTTRDAIEYVYNKNNIDVLKDSFQKSSAASVLIGEPWGEDCWRIDHNKNLQTHAQTRLQTFPTCNVLIAPDAESMRLKSLSKREIIDLIKCHCYFSVPVYLIDKWRNKEITYDMHRNDWLSNYIIFNENDLQKEMLI